MVGTIKHVSINSNEITSAGYDRRNRQMEVLLKDNTTESFDNIPYALWDEFELTFKEGHAAVDSFYQTEFKDTNMPFTTHDAKKRDAAA